MIWAIIFLILIPIVIAAISPLIAALIVVAAVVLAAVVAVVVVAFAIFLPLALIALPIWLIYQLGNRWMTMMMLFEDNFDAGIMKVPTFYSSTLHDGELPATFLLLSITGVVFGGIHCAGWFFTFPSNDEVILWRVSSAVVTGIAFLIPSSFYLFGLVSSESTETGIVTLWLVVTFFAVITYVLSRLILLVEAFISLRHLTTGMLEVVKWTSFIPHI
jgi:hypothetical protein